MKHLSILTLFSLLFFLFSCDDSQIVEGVDAGAIIVTNSIDNELSVTSGNTVNVEFQISPYENTSLQEYKDVTFSSTDSGIFEVDENGVVSGKKNGTARLVIAASSDDHEVRGSCVVRVTGQVFVENIDIDESIKNIRINIYENDKFQISEEDWFVMPQSALIRDVVFASSNPTIATVSQSGLITGVSGGTAIISIISTDGSGVKAEISVTVLAPIFTWYLEERQNFVFEYRSDLIKHPLNPDGVYGDDWNLLIDEGSGWEASFISMSKPGRGSIPSAVIGDVFIPIDMQQELKFNMIFIRHRSQNTLARLRMWGFNLLASDDGVEFYTLEEGIVIPGANVDSQNLEATILLNDTYTARYIKIVPSDWDRTNGNSMQIADLKIGYDESKDPDFGI